MRSAPPVLVPVGRFVWGPRVALGLALLSALVFWLAWRASSASIVQGAIGMVTWGTVCLLSWRLSVQDMLPAGDLVWDGEAWCFAPQTGVTVPVNVHVLWDLGPAMLVGLDAVQGAGWGGRFTWLSARQMPGVWHGWRCAVYGRDIL